MEERNVEGEGNELVKKINSFVVEEIPESVKVWRSCDDGPVLTGE